MDLLAAEASYVFDEAVNLVVVHAVLPGRHVLAQMGCLAPLLDGREERVVRDGLHASTVREVTRLGGESVGLRSVAFALLAVALGAEAYEVLLGGGEVCRGHGKAGRHNQQNYQSNRSHPSSPSVTMASKRACGACCWPRHYDRRHRSSLLHR